MQSIVRKYPNSLSETSFVLKAGEEEKICLNCSLPEKSCHPDRCKRLREELKKLKKKGACK